MFDRSFHYRSGDHHTTLNQQPHDAADAARLYGQLQAKAESAVVETVAQQLPSIDAQYARIQSERLVMHLKDRHTVVFKINGRTIKTIIERDEIDTHTSTMRKELQAVAEAITSEIMNHISADLCRANFGRMYAR